MRRRSLSTFSSVPNPFRLWSPARVSEDGKSGSELSQDEDDAIAGYESGCTDSDSNSPPASRTGMDSSGPNKKTSANETGPSSSKKSTTTAGSTMADGTGAENSVDDTADAKSGITDLWKKKKRRSSSSLKLKKSSKDKDADKKKKKEKKEKSPTKNRKKSSSPMNVKTHLAVIMEEGANDDSVLSNSGGVVTTPTDQAAVTSSSSSKEASKDSPKKKKSKRSSATVRPRWMKMTQLLQTDTTDYSEGEVTTATSDEQASLPPKTSKDHRSTVVEPPPIFPATFVRNRRGTIV